MEYKLKNIKYSDFASHETFCFEATLYINGKRSYIVSNDGQGGCNNYYPVSNDVENINENEIEQDVFNMVNDYLTNKELKKLLKKVVYTKNDGHIYTLPNKFKPSIDLFKKLKNQSWWEKSFVILNDLSFDDAKDIFMTAS